MGFSVVAPLTVLGAYVNATERVLRRSERTGTGLSKPRLSRQGDVRVPGYYADAERYDGSTSGK